MKVPARLGLVKSSLLLLLPISWVVYKMLSNGASANPAKDLNHLFGDIGFYMLAINISIGSALFTLKTLKRSWPSSLRFLIPFRRHLGVAGTLYIAIHVALHFVLEAGISEGFEAILKAQYLWWGSISFLILTVLSLTSNDLAIRKLGRKWKSLHRLAYVAMALTSLHALSIEKADLIHFGWISLLCLSPLLIRLLRFATISRTKMPSVN